MYHFSINYIAIRTDRVRSEPSELPRRRVSHRILAFRFSHYSCSNGDTWSSELGVLSSGNPILVTTFRRVPKGTNGGVSALGMIASVAAGFVIGLGYFLSSWAVLGSASEWPVVLIATLAAPLGSLVRLSLGSRSPDSKFTVRLFETV